MQNDTAKNMAKMVVGALKDGMGKGASYFYIDEVNEDSKAFTVRFIAYNYMWVSIGSERGGISASVLGGGGHIPIDGFDNWWEEIDLTEWVPKLDEEIRLMIPDKYLKAKGWA